MTDKDETALALALAHREVEPTIIRIVRLQGPNEADASEPVKLLEVNPDTVASGIWPVAFTPDPASKIFHGSVIVEVTPDEYEEILAKRLSLPEGWQLGATLFAAA